MDDSSSEEDRRILQEMVGRSGVPAFIRRARLVESTWQALLDACACARLERLTFVRLRLGQLHALAGDWQVIRAAMPNDADFAFVRRLFDELQPSLQLPLDRTTSKRALRGAAQELLEAIDLFDARWTRWLAKADLSAVNKAREDYNRFYLLEKECAVGNPRVARVGFAKLAPATLADLQQLFPLLMRPDFEF